VGLGLSHHVHVESAKSYFSSQWTVFVTAGIVAVTMAGLSWFKHHRCGEGATTEVVIHILDLARPVLGEHVFEARADSVAIAIVAIETETDGAPAKVIFWLLSE
jgi:hypothetical protein